MPTLDPRIDDYIARAAPFARPILGRLRELVHAGCPEVVETLKWSAPAFGFHGPLAQMAAFKAHCVFGFWKGALVAESLRERPADAAMGQFGRLASLADLPADEVVLAWTRRAAELNLSGVKAARPPKHPKPEIALPEELRRAFATPAHAAAGEAFAALRPSHRREYLEWIVDAKRPATRAQRVATTLAWLAEGKPLNWKYQR